MSEVLNPSAPGVPEDPARVGDETAMKLARFPLGRRTEAADHQAWATDHWPHWPTPHTWDGWFRRLDDPFYAEFMGADATGGTGVPDFARMAERMARPRVPPAADPSIIWANVERLAPLVRPTVDTGIPFVDLSVLAGLAHVDAVFQRDHPKYGAGNYGRNVFDAFAETIIAVVDALTLWGLNERAAQVWRYWLLNMLGPDGRMTYAWPSVTEYGRLLHTAALMHERAGPDGWWDEATSARLDAMAEHVLRLVREAREVRGNGDGLISAMADEDTKHQVYSYFHLNAWVAKGLRRWAQTCERVGFKPRTAAAAVRKIASDLADATLAAIERAWPTDPSDWWLPPCPEPVERPRSLTDGQLASYTNYRFYPELLSSELLPPALANRVIDARLSGGGSICGMSRFMAHTDDWPLAEYLYGVWTLGRKGDFLYSLYGHCLYQQDRDNLTACEQLTLPPGVMVTPHCLPCQLVPARAARLINRRQEVRSAEF